jgi:hypothetical protein
MSCTHYGFRLEINNHCAEVTLSTHFLQAHGVNVAKCNREVVEQSKVVWLTVKPHAIASVLSEIAPVIQPDHHVVVSAAAGIPIKTLEKVRDRALEWIEVKGTRVGVWSGDKNRCGQSRGVGKHISGWLKYGGDFIQGYFFIHETLNNLCWHLGHSYLRG